MTRIAEFHWSPLYIHDIDNDDLLCEILNNIADKDINWKINLDEIYILFYDRFCDGDISDYFTINKNSIRCEKVFDPEEAAYTVEYECDINKLSKDVDAYLITKYAPIIKLSNYINGLDSNVEKMFTDRNFSSVNDYLTICFTDGIIDAILMDYEPVNSVEKLFEDIPEIIPLIEDKSLVKSCLEQMITDIRSLIEE